jgi:hypothetical protein
MREMMMIIELILEQFPLDTRIYWNIANILMTINMQGEFLDKTIALFSGANHCNNLVELDDRMNYAYYGNEGQKGENVYINVAIVIHGIADSDVNA